MKYKVFVLTMILLFFQFISCNDELVVDQNELNNSTDNLTLTKEGDLLSTLQDSISLKEKKAKVLRLKQEHEKPYIVIEKPEKLLAEKLKSRTLNKSISKSSTNSKLNSVQGIQSCYTLEIDVWALLRYEAKTGIEFGILPHTNRQYAGSSGDPYRIQKLNELKSKWGFNYILASIGVYENIMAIVNAGYPIATNYIAGISCNQAGRDAAANVWNGLSPSTYFWAYYTDEPYSNQQITQYDFKQFRNYIVQLRPNSLFGFGETTKYSANRYTHNPYFWNGFWVINYNPTSVNFVMCTRYVGYYNEKDQTELWNELKSSYQDKFNRTWISANSDGSEFNYLLGYCKDNNISPWFYQLEDFEDNSDVMLSQYCYYAFSKNFLKRVDKKFIYIYYYVGSGDPCYDYQITSWELGDIIETSETRILNP